MAELALEEKFHGAEKEAFILLAAVTSIRAEALVSAEWSNIKYNKKNDLYVVKVIDKGDEYVTAPFDKVLYAKLVSLKKENENRLFPNLTVDSINDAVKRLAAKMGIPVDERITTHSLRKTAPVFELEDSGSLERAQKQTRHKSVQVLADHYTDKTKDFGTLAGIRMFQEVDESVFENVSKEDILAMLKQVNLAAYNQLALKLTNAN
jgi:integrase